MISRGGALSCCCGAEDILKRGDRRGALPLKTCCKFSCFGKMLATNCSLGSVTMNNERGTRGCLSPNFKIFAVRVLISAGDWWERESWFRALLTEKHSEQEDRSISFGARELVTGSVTSCQNQLPLFCEEFWACGAEKIFPFSFLSLS